MQPLELVDNELESQEKQPAAVVPERAPEPLPRSFERFMLLSRVARGGMGEVYLAAARSIEGAERPLIVKIIRPDHADDRSFVARFLDEARIQAQLQHPGVAQILEATTCSSGKPYVVVEHVEGRNLSELRTRAGQLGVRISWPEALALGVCMAEALVHIHERTDPDGRPLEIVHRDLSPQNVMVGYGGEVKLIDFGTARGQNRRCQTISGIVFAKPGYVAPEVANNTPGGVPADLYAFGVILWELLAGRRFLSGEASTHLAAVAAGRRTLPPLARILGAPPELDALLGNLTATSMDERYAAARLAVQDIVKLLQRAPSLADGDRSVRGRIADVMRRLYPAEPARSRADFARKVAEARSREPQLLAQTLAPPPSPPPPESDDPALLAGTRYRITRLIGRGAMGSVHEALQVDLGRTVALKILETDMSAEAQSRFRAEARAIAQLSHDNLIKIHDFGVCRDGRPYYAMELLEGETLAARLDRHGRLPESAVIDYGIQACRALSAAHRAGVVHRDVKPANLFVTSAGTLKVLDFGVAKAENADVATGTHGDALVIIGTPEYMAPEQARGSADARSDVYALGTVLFELATGELPFDSENPLEIIAKKSERPPRATEIGRGMRLSAGLERAIQKALEPSPEKRHESAAALQRELERLIAAPAVRRPLLRRALIGSITALVAVGAVGLVPAALRVPSARDFTRAEIAPIAARVLAFAEDMKSRRAALIAEREHAHDASEHAALDGATVRSASAAVEHGAAAPQPASDPAGVEASDDESSDTNVDAKTDDSSSPPPSTTDADAAAALAQAERLTAKGRELSALELLRKSAERHPRSPEVFAALSTALEKNRSWGDAVRAARQRVELDPTPAARLSLARLERATGHRDRAIALLTPLAAEQSVASEARELLRMLAPGSRVALRD